MTDGHYRVEWVANQKWQLTNNLWFGVRFDEDASWFPFVRRRIDIRMGKKCVLIGRQNGVKSELWRRVLVHLFVPRQCKPIKMKAPLAAVRRRVSVH